MPADNEDRDDDRLDDIDGTVLSPEELDIVDDEHVVELDDGRYLISPGAEPADRRRLVRRAAEDAQSSADARPDADAVHDWLARRLESADSRYGFDITAVFEGDVDRQELFSNDVVTTFETLLVWYAQHVGGDTPVEDVLGILLAESTAPIRFPPHAVETLMATYDLGPEATLADLVAAVREAGGLRFPPADSS